MVWISNVFIVVVAIGSINLHLQTQAKSLTHHRKPQSNKTENSLRRYVVTTEETEDTYFIPQGPAMIPNYPVSVVPAIMATPPPKHKHEHEEHEHVNEHVLLNQNKKPRQNEHILVNQNENSNEHGYQDKHENDEHEHETKNQHEDDHENKHETKNQHEDEHVKEHQHENKYQTGNVYQPNKEHQDKNVNLHEDNNVDENENLHEKIQEKDSYHQTTKFKTYRGVGCYKDALPRAVPILEGSDSILTGYYKTRISAVEECARVAKDRGYEIFTIQNGGFCSSGPNAHSTFQTYGPAKNCKNGRGGEWGSNVYIFNDYVYEITVHTGVEQKSSTRAKVSVILYGTLGTSSKLLLKSNELNSNPFESGKVDTFTVHSIPLGDLIRMHVCQHDDEHEEAEWYLEKVSVKDPKNKIYIFPCNCWLTHNQDKGRFDRNLLPATILDPGSLKYLGCYKRSNIDGVDHVTTTEGYLDGHPSSTLAQVEYVMERCANEARQKGSLFFGINNGNRCVSSTIVQDTYNMYGRAGGCYQNNTGSASSMAVYTFTNQEPVTTRLEQQ